MQRLVRDILVGVAVLESPQAGRAEMKSVGLKKKLDGCRSGTILSERLLDYLLDYLGMSGSTPASSEMPAA